MLSGFAVERAPNAHRRRWGPSDVVVASLVVLADRYGTDTIGSLDERHFRVVQSLSGRPLRVLPADADT